MEKIRWGVLSTAKIGREKVIPALQKCIYGQVDAICSRDLEQAQKTADQLNIEKAYGSYEELLADKDIDAVYIPLPNHLHVEWTIKAMEAGKHVLCEKPIGLSSKEAALLLNATKGYPHLKVMEAFMYRYHSQWIKAIELISQGKIGELRTVQSFFTFYNIDPNDVRNKVDIGGGALMDIGCYCISLSRLLFGEEPHRVMGLIDRDPVMLIDRMTSGILEFSKGTATFTCSTQLMPHQRVNILGTKGRIGIDIPFNIPPNQRAFITLFTPSGSEEFFFDAADHYTLQGDLFAQAILNDTPVPFGLEDAVNNMKVIDAVFESAKDKSWKTL